VTTTAARNLQGHTHRLELSDQWTWIGGGIVFSFLVPFVFADRLEINRDVYYGIYAASVLSFLWLWTRSTHLWVPQLIRHRWVLGVALGVVFGGVIALLVTRAVDGTPHPSGLDFAAALLWRGVVYGAIDGLLLSVFPIIAVFTAFRDSKLRKTLSGTLMVGVVALLASLAITTSYHLGYSDFRSQKVTKTLLGLTVSGTPTLVTLNPLGAPIAHISQHLTALVHDYNGDLFLPPHR
jgi:hypothetical protein